MSTRPGQDMLIQGLTGIAAATGRGDGPPVPVGAGFSDQIGAMNMVYGILAALYWRERSGKGQEIKVDLMSGMLAHQGQEMLMAMNFGEDFQRPEFRHRPSRHGRAVRRLPDQRRLGDDRHEPLQAGWSACWATQPACLRRPGTLFDKRDEIWEKLAALTRKLDHRGPARGDARRRHLVRRGEDPS